MFSNASDSASRGSCCGKSEQSRSCRATPATSNPIATVRPTASGGYISFPTSEAANLGAADYFGKHLSGSPAPHVRVYVEGEGVAEPQSEEATSSDEQA